MNINENQYSLTGLVKIYDAETNELVYETHNMIVESGRKLILKAIFNKSALDPAKFKKYYETNNEALTTPNMAYSNIQSNVSETMAAIATTSGSTVTYNQTTVTTPGSATQTTYTDTVNENGICMEMHFKIAKATNVMEPVTAIGLLYNTSGSNYTLFSRAAIDPVFMRPDRVYICHYTLYF